MSRERNAFEQAGSDVVEYVKLRVDDAKLGLVDHLATFSSTIFGVVLCLILAGIAVLFLSAAAVLWLAALTGSFPLAALIVAAVLLIAAAVVFAMRKRLIVNPMVKVFCKMLFENKNNYRNYE